MDKKEDCCDECKDVVNRLKKMIDSKNYADIYFENEYKGDKAEYHGFAMTHMYHPILTNQTRISIDIDKGFGKDSDGNFTTSWEQMQWTYVPPSGSGWGASGGYNSGEPTGKALDTPLGVVLAHEVLGHAYRTVIDHQMLAPERETQEFEDEARKCWNKNNPGTKPLDPRTVP